MLQRVKKSFSQSNRKSNKSERPFLIEETQLCDGTHNVRRDLWGKNPDFVPHVNLIANSKECAEFIQSAFSNLEDTSQSFGHIASVDVDVDVVTIAPLGHPDQYPNMTDFFEKILVEIQDLGFFPNGIPLSNAPAQRYGQSVVRSIWHDAVKTGEEKQSKRSHPLGSVKFGKVGKHPGLII